jgi:tetratricopeptide (TPR) repeat protein
MLREAQAIAKLSHPNVVVVYEVGTFDGAIFIAMEFIEGRTLAEWLAEGDRSWRDVLAVFLQAARGLSAAHRAGFVHRDFKPQNVMVTADGHVRVMDFGLARRIDDDAAVELNAAPAVRSRIVVGGTLTVSGEQLGTPLYMAPEQFASARIDARADQFSFCVSLFWALFGEHPFGAGEKTTARRPKVPASPAWLRAVITRGLSVDPEKRWPSMDQLIAALAREPIGRSKRLISAVAVLAVVSGIVALATRQIERSLAICQGGAARMSAVWELPDNVAGPSTRRESVRAAILRSGVAGALKIWDSVAVLFDRQSARWLAAYKDACVSTHVRKEQSEEILDLRMECLTENLDSMRAFTEILTHGSKGVIENSVKVASSLDDLERCKNVQQLRLGVQPPKDPMIRGEVAEMRRRLKSAEALLDTGERAAGGALAETVVERAEKIGYCPLLAEALAIAGDGKYPDLTAARATLERAIDTGEACGADRVVVRASAQIVFMYGVRDWRLAERAAGLARAGLERIGGDLRLEGWLANNLGGLRYRQNRHSEALRELERALRIKKANYGEEHIDVAMTESNRSVVLAKLGRLPEALAISDHVLRVYGEWLSPSSFWLAETMENHASILRRLGRLDEADEYANKVLAVTTEDYDSSLMASGAVRTLGLTALARRQPSIAVAHLERSLRLLRAVEGPPFEVAETQFALARALAQAGPNRRRAARLAREALAVYATEPTFEHERSEVKAWIDRSLSRTVEM